MTTPWRARLHRLRFVARPGRRQRAGDRARPAGRADPARAAVGRAPSAAGSSSGCRVAPRAGGHDRPRRRRLGRRRPGARAGGRAHRDRSAGRAVRDPECRTRVQSSWAVFRRNHALSEFRIGGLDLGSWCKRRRRLAAVRSGQPPCAAQRRGDVLDGRSRRDRDPLITSMSAVRDAEHDPDLALGASWCSRLLNRGEITCVVVPRAPARQRFAAGRAGSPISTSIAAPGQTYARRARPRPGQRAAARQTPGGRLRSPAAAARRAGPARQVAAARHGRRARAGRPARGAVLGGVVVPTCPRQTPLGRTGAAAWCRAASWSRLAFARVPLSLSLSLSPPPPPPPHQTPTFFRKKKSFFPFFFFFSPPPSGQRAPFSLEAAGDEADLAVPAPRAARRC